MSGLEYLKIYTLYEREADFKVDTTKLNKPEFGLIKIWIVTEKINGRNTRITLLKSGEVIYGGKTDDADIPSTLLQYLIKTFTPEKMKQVFWLDENIPEQVTLYGEGYGSKMASGSGIYRKDNDVSFRLFDCLVDTWWLESPNREDIASKLGIRCTPVLGFCTKLPETKEDILSYFKNNTSTVVQEEGLHNNVKYPEGIVARTEPLLFTRSGERLIWKLKIKDFR